MGIRFGSKKNFSIKDISSARDIALFVLLEITENKRKSNTILKETFENAKRTEGAVADGGNSGAQGSNAPGIGKADRAFIERLVIGTLDRMITIDAVLNRFLAKPVKSQKPVIRGILRISVYQLMYMDRVPESAAVNEAVKLTKLHGMEGLSGLVNGVLRNISRELSSGGKKVTEFNSASERYSLPAWLCSYIEKDCGKEKAEEIFKAYLMERSETLRFNLSCTGIDDAENAEALILSELKADGLAVRRIDMKALIAEAGVPMPAGRLPVMYELTEGGDITCSEAFKKGHIIVQDPSSALLISYAAPSEKDFVLDVCAAPGGKTLAAAEHMNGKGRIEARDISRAKTSLIEENVKRCGYKNISVRMLDALTEDEDSFYRADVLLADLPCSGLGVIAKKPDIKFNLEEYSIEELSGLQRDILSNVSRFVKPKGRLIYSTCTISRAENEDNVSWMEQNLGLEKVTTARLLPGRDHDGFFIAVMKKRY
ncbi:MAG: 16S rRNA (cytosine(967)-C(5))-methyltransferase RsmB [Eubacteriales bacterium]|nr:16S rRNA (cytosine(967)-C(5))-methyltransferase RsmB [Eubacteriales bacterium]